jgi:hypothetical protein
MKTTKQQFEAFKASFLSWQARLGLTQYTAYFFHQPLDGNYATIEVDEMGKVCSVSMTTSIQDAQLSALFNPETHAAHECMHLVSHRLVWLGRQRCICDSDIDEEWEALTRRLQHVLLGGES